MAATLSSGMNRNIAKLLIRHLQTSSGAWLCAALAMQFLVTSAVWALGVAQEFLPGVLLLAIANVQSARGRGLVWQTLPISRREVGLANWYATSALPALALSLALLLAVASNRSAGWPIPRASSITLQIAGIWAAFGYTRWLALRTRIGPGSGATSRLIFNWSAPLLATFCGYPLRPPLSALSVVIIAVGCALLVHSFLEARSAVPPGTLRKPAALAQQGIRSGAARAVAPGRSQIMIAVATQTAWMLTLGLGGACLLRLMYPRATQALVWVFIAAATIWSNLAAQRWSRSLWPWRCLPVTMRRAALALQAVQLLPLSVTISAAWILGQLAPQFVLPIPGWLPPATIALSGWSGSQARLIVRRQRTAHSMDNWLPSWTAVMYLSLLMVVQPLARHFEWMPALVWVAAGLLLIGSFRMTLTELRSCDPIHQTRQPGAIS